MNNHENIKYLPAEQAKDLIKVGSFIFEYDRYGNMINWLSIFHTCKSKDYFLAGKGGAYKFSKQILTSGKLIKINDPIGSRPSSFYIQRDTAENDYSILLFKQEVIAQINKVTDVKFLNELYAEGKKLITEAKGNKSRQAPINRTDL